MLFKYNITHLDYVNYVLQRPEQSKNIGLLFIHSSCHLRFGLSYTPTLITIIIVHLGNTYMKCFTNHYFSLIILLIAKWKMRTIFTIFLLFIMYYSLFAPTSISSYFLISSRDFMSMSTTSIHILWRQHNFRAVENPIPTMKTWPQRAWPLALPND